MDPRTTITAFDDFLAARSAGFSGIVSRTLLPDPMPTGDVAPMTIARARGLSRSMP